jgi:Tfp pilus assembly protein PilX
MVLIILVTVAARSVATHANISTEQINMEVAFCLAEAGAERGADYIANGGKTPHSFSGQLGEGTYHVTITGKSTSGEGSGIAINGLININPNNSSQNEFTLIKANGSTITRDTLTQSFSGYTGDAKAIRIKPEGNGNQNKLIVNDQTYSLQNSTTYDITSSSMNVSLFNDHVNKNGKALGRWYISIGASDATISP